MRTIALLIVCMFAGANAAFAGPQYVDASGYALSGYDAVAYQGLKQSGVGTALPKAVPGKASITASYNGAKWAFSSEVNRDRFQADPAKYAPQYDGHCAYGASKGGKAPANPYLWRIVDGKLYINYNKTVSGFWRQDIPGHIKRADRNWKNIGPKPATTRAVPDIDTANAPK